jgi:hypothetical protein
MKWRWTTEEERRAECLRWKARGKVAYLWRVGILRMGVLWGAGMLIYVIFFSPRTHEPSTGGYVSIAAVTIFVAGLFGSSVGLILWRQMMNKYS